MRLSAKVEYVIKAVLELAIRTDIETPVQISSIAKAQNIPQKFLLQILLRLKNAGLVKSVRGVDGGYCLARHPNKIKLSDVVSAIDDNILVQLPTRKRATRSEGLIDKIWTETNEEIVAKFASITLEDMRSQIMSGREAMYFI